MNDKLMERFSVGRRAEEVKPPVPAADEPDPLNLGLFGVLRGTSERAVMLELRKRDGDILAFGYAWLERAAFSPSEGITLFAAGWEINITGRNLNKEVRPNIRLYESLTRHRVAWLREADQAESLQAAEEATVIERIGWKEAKRQANVE